MNLSVVIPTVARASLWRAVSSVFHQEFKGEIQVLIGVDVDASGGAATLKERILDSCPPGRSVTWIDPGYSTSQRHGGPHACAFGGSLRTALTFLAKHRHVLYLDDDDWLAENHCVEVAQAIGENPWAFAYSFYSDGDLSEPLCVDALESVGVDKGIYRESQGGFVRPSGLLLDKVALAPILHLWAEAAFRGGDGEDRLIFKHLKGLKHGCTGKASVFYSLDPKDSLHPLRLQYIQAQGKLFRSAAKKESVR